MVDRQVIQWDKDDALALGMLSAMRRGFDLLRDHKGSDLSTVPVEAGRHGASVPT